MRWAILVAVMSGLAAGATHGQEFRAANEAAVVCTRSGSDRIELRIEGEIPIDRPLVRLLELPAGAQNVRATPITSADVTGVELTVGRPMVMRGVSLLPLEVAAAGVAGTTGATDAAGTFELVVQYEPSRARAEQEAASGARTGACAFSRGFFDAWGAELLLDESRSAERSAAEGGYLIVTIPEFVPTLQPLVDWKREIGFEVTVVTTDETGTRNDEIQAYIRNLYWAAERPPQYVLIAGDVEQIPGFDYHQSVSDLPYALVDGDDFLPDMEVGRLSAQNVFQLETIVAKLLRYQQAPAMDDEGWFSRALLVAGDYSSSTPVAVSHWCGDQLTDLGYTDISWVDYPPHWSTGPTLIKRAIDQGVSIVSYRGWAYGWRGWQPPEFTVDDIPRLDNGWMLPAVFSFVCLNGDFTEPECFGESWIRAGSATEPKGAVAFIGNSEHWSHTRFNDTAAIGAFRAMNNSGVRRLGAILQASKTEIFTQFHEQMYYEEWQDESAEFYFYIYGLLGDPSMEIWTATPRGAQVEHAAALPVGSTTLDVRVLEADGITPVENARVGLARGETHLGCVFTDADGRANVLATITDGETPVTLTVTGTGLAPYRTTLAVGSGEPFLALEDVQVLDDGSDGSQGNGDGIPNPGETLALRVALTNQGPDMVADASASLDALWGATVVAGDAEYPVVASGERSDPETPFLVHIGATAEAGLRPRFRLDVDNGGNQSLAGFQLEVVAPRITYESHLLDADGVLDPGESADLRITVRNEGTASASASSAVLRSETPDLATVLGESAEYAAVDVDGTAEPLSAFRVQAAGDAAVGRAAVFTLTSTTAEGYVSETSFSLVIGTVDHRAPLGPDAYGYWAYDNSDTDYPEAVPTYDWIPCSTVYGGEGTRLDLGDNSTAVVDLPFSFTYYGRTYDQIAVCDNGWVSFEIADYADFYNWTMPNTYGNGAQIAPFWDNLDPDKSHDGVPVGDGIYVWSDEANHRFVVEWSRIGNIRSQHDEEDRPDYDDLQTFQLVLFDPAFRPTPTGDGIVRFQYKQIVNNDVDRMFSTVGIENETEDVGLQYTYANSYPGAAAPLSAGLAIEFSTVPPRYEPFRLAAFTATRQGSGVRLDWEPCDARPRGAYRVYRSTPGAESRVAIGGRLGPSATAFLDADADPNVPCSYWIGSTDPVGFETVLGPFTYTGRSESPLELALEAGPPNPSRSYFALTYAVPSAAPVRLAIYDATGRMVRTLVDDTAQPGIWDATWDGRDDAGSVTPSGIYFARIASGSQQRSVKLTRVR
ncbi:MAG: C25 family cysteine peptidase [Candidatus Eisenbacteria bacterium]